MSGRHFSPDGALPGRRGALRAPRVPSRSTSRRSLRTATGVAVLAVPLAALALLPGPRFAEPGPADPRAAAGATPVPTVHPWAAGLIGSAAPALTAPVSAAPASAAPASAAPASAAPAAGARRPVGPRPAPLRLSGAVPVRGDGTFAYAPGTGRVLGGSGTVRRFRVGVERGSGEDVGAFAAEVEAALADPRSWAGDGKLRLQRVGSGRYDFTVYLATRETAGRMCLRGGVDIRVGGRPYTSCRAPGGAIVNLDRWRLSAPTFVRAGVPLATYRAYVVNHEVGHELGRSHQGCPARGGPAPVMVQQTLTLRGCTPYPWPRLDGRLFTGPGLR